MRTQMPRNFVQENGSSRIFARQAGGIISSSSSRRIDGWIMALRPV
jgi:hypothetical protein